MTYKAVIFDLDDTLLIEVASAEAAFIDTCSLVQDKYGWIPMSFIRFCGKRPRNCGITPRLPGSTASESV